jgi:hypothetical protein
MLFLHKLEYQIFHYPKNHLIQNHYKGVIDNPNNAKTAMRASIVTQILCHVYAYMNNLEDKETDIHGGLLEHMRTVKETNI